jgi:hypothetical protein
LTVFQGFIEQPHITVPGRGATFGSVPLEKRFWAKVVKSEGCWNWRGSTDSKGRANINTNGRPKYAAIVSWEMINGTVPNGLVVCHKCDNKLCVRPDHLWVGTQRENMQDMIDKGRMKLPPRTRGEKHPTAKVTWDIVREIRANTTDTQATMAVRYGLCVSAVGHIKSGRNWKE